ncbi:phasin family protein [Eoetvoesiella caeni]|uniref:Phasin protein n=1 Tax=Eoetvoesiella caeni TaxID=645616 RepID=A0A366H104_9BURK|nr:phasin family protein [Eoetvoesiella caeni]MCI2810927.1 phasin family protein [Eoetvoesiella caeni]NYT56773.1 phasin family protein [Eoetvoesiella caeni]RBP35572.1 phasin protein [Eoetvoesiella caeni]
MSTENFSVNLYKTNLELQLRIMQLLQDNRQRWLEAAQQRNTDAMAKTEAEIEGLSQAVDLQSFVTLPADTVERLFQTGMSSTQTMNEIAIKNQTELTAGLQQALQDWQKGVTQLLGSSANFAPWLLSSMSLAGKSAPAAKQKKTAE